MSAANLNAKDTAELEEDMKKEVKSVRKTYLPNQGFAPFLESLDVCEDDADADGFTNGFDDCDSIPNPDQLDSDCDGVGDPCDTCPGTWNPEQRDCNHNLIGDECEPGALVGQTAYSSSNPPLPIPDGGGSGVSSTILVLNSGFVIGTDVRLWLTHTRQSDLIVTLEHQGRAITLLKRPGTPQPLAGCSPSGGGYSADNFGTPGNRLLLTDCAPVEADCYDGAGPGVVNFSGPARPNRRLDAFSGSDSSGAWTLRAFDAATGDTGVFRNWQITLRTLTLPNDANHDAIPDECESLGSVPTTLHAFRLNPNRIRLIWAPPACPGASDYAIYEGLLGSWYSHSMLDCTDDGHDFVEDVDVSPGDTYYLVVPHDADFEGSYGQSSLGQERPRGGVTCNATQVLGTCP